MLEFREGDILVELRKIKDNSIDCIITSPPYNLKNGILKSESSAISVNYNSYSDNKDNLEYEIWQIEILNELFRVLKPTGHLFYNHKPRYEKGEYIHPLTWLTRTPFYFYQEIIWETKRRVDNGGYRFTPQTERIYWLKKDKSNLNKLSKAFITSDLWNLGRSERFNKHPAPFPLALPQRILTSLYGDLEDNEKEKITILDPFSGSGTVAKACKYLGLNSLGIEMDGYYIKLANERLEVDETENWERERENYIVKSSYKSKRKGGQYEQNNNDFFS